VTGQLIEILQTYNKKTLAFVALLLITALVCSQFVFVCSGASVVPDVVVENEAELLNAISAAPDKKSYVIGLSEDIALKNSLEIPENKNITLIMFGSASSFVSLLGNNTVDTIIVNNGGTLVLLDGIVITHMKNDNGRGVYIRPVRKLVSFLIVC
jgi:hypothetical protein